MRETTDNKDREILPVFRTWPTAWPVYIHHERSGVCKPDADPFSTLGELKRETLGQPPCGGGRVGAANTLRATSRIYIHHERLGVCKPDADPFSTLSELKRETLGQPPLWGRTGGGSKHTQGNITHLHTPRALRCM